ncbi:DNA-binding response regulator [Nocardia panacis]|uniref:DNA-binding response regulator n=1 Tax=Nocardia panacis TaxID=2340916 RepID=A0A3A4JVU1_9NOCA|nr:response regulator transcription factor [Nocardia panacis]RJO70692.1 DNA-binding response regulator [Nocardia panacis]
MNDSFDSRRLANRHGGLGRTCLPMRTRERTVLIASDSPFLRDDFERALAGSQELTLAGTSGIREVAEKTRRWCPDVVLLDASVAPVPGLGSLAQHLRALDYPPSVVLLVQRHAERSQLEFADVVLAAECGIPAVLQSLRLVTSGAVVFVGRSRPTKSTDLEMRQRLSSLTDREREILLLIVGGLSNREVGARLFISLDTVKEHVSRILTKLQVASRIEAAVVAVRAEHARSGA